MAASINASTSAGVVTTADTSGNLNLQSNGTTKLAITSTGTAVAGTNTNDSAAAGYVGEYIEGVVAQGSAVSMTTGVAINVTSISLTAGDWDVSAIAKGATGGSAVISWVRSSISTTSATYSDMAAFSNESSQTTVNIGGHSFGIPPVRFSLASTTTIYLTLQCAWTPGSFAGYGTLRARRVR